MNALFIRNLKKIDSNGFSTLKGINLDIEKGGFFALLGSNGTGKLAAKDIIGS